MNPHGIPGEMRGRRQWVIWRTELRDRKTTKVPYRAAKPGVRASSTDPATWGTFEQALGPLELPGVDGLGFVFTEKDPYAGVDLDRCLGRGGPDRRLIAIVARLNSYTEISPSQSGVHVIVRGSVGGGRRNGPIEIYDRSRFFCMTGEPLSRQLPASPMPRQAELDELVASLRPPPASPAPVPDAPVTLDDQELLRRACTARNGAQVARLWDGDWSGYPSQSEADAALCRHLSYWTGGDTARVDALFRRSGLYREKWERRPDYRERTLALATGREYGGAA